MEEIMDDVTGGSQPFESWCALNRGFSEVLKALSEIEESHLVRPAMLQDLRLSVEEARAWANFEMAAASRDTAEIDWARFGKLRRQRESDQHREDG
jgi:hypothetical protein